MTHFNIYNIKKFISTAEMFLLQLGQEKKHNLKLINSMMKINIQY